MATDANDSDEILTPAFHLNEGAPLLSVVLVGIIHDRDFIWPIAR
jgi:hypothetical protein